jgi:hypothetical protein
MNQFKDLNIKIETPAFTGKSIEVSEVLNNLITIYGYKIGPSKYPGKGNGKCLTLQIEFENKKRIIFTGSGVLMSIMEQIDETKFPFTATIVEINKRFELK